MLCIRVSYLRCQRFSRSVLDEMLSRLSAVGIEGGKVLVKLFLVGIVSDRVRKPFYQNWTYFVELNE